MEFSSEDDFSSEKETEFQEEEHSLQEKIEIAENIFYKLKFYCEVNELDILTSPSSNYISDLVYLID